MTQVQAKRMASPHAGGGLNPISVLGVDIILSLLLFCALASLGLSTVAALLGAWIGGAALTLLVLLAAAVVAEQEPPPVAATSTTA
jgi:O-antigen ligase